MTKKELDNLAKAYVAIYEKHDRIVGLPDVDEATEQLIHEQYELCVARLGIKSIHDLEENDDPGIGADDEPREVCGYNPEFCDCPKPSIR
jgi:hypothetical protein